MRRNESLSGIFDEVGEGGVTFVVFQYGQNDNVSLKRGGSHKIEFLIWKFDCETTFAYDIGVYPNGWTKG
jgi:hypothetical protein